MVLFRRLDGHVGGGTIFIALDHAELLLQDSVVADMAVSVTFGAPVCGPQIDNFCTRSEYATFSTLSAPGVREMTISVMVCALRFGPSVTPRRRPIVGPVAGTEHVGGFSTNAILIS